MRSRSRGRRRSVDKGTCGPGIQPRKTFTPGRRRCKEMRKAPSGAPISRGVPESRAVTDPVHVRKHLQREPGDPRFSHGRSWFDAISHEWLVKFIEHRIADGRVVRLIQKWLNAGVLEDGRRIRVEEGTPQGGSASPLLANVYLH